MPEHYSFIVTTAFGLEAISKRELEKLGYAAEVTGPGWLRFSADIRAIARANLWLRTADRVLVELASFSSLDFETLFETTRQLPWHEWIPPDGAFPVTGRSVKSQLSSVPACQRAVKKAIVESLRTNHKVDTLPETGSEYRCQIALLKDQATLTIDTTGPSLHKRGYRKFANQAPLKETLAAALIQLSFWKPDRPLLDPFCGSGTIPIEAALIGRNIAPGIQRSFAAEQWPQLAQHIWHEAREEARQSVLPPFDERLLGTDIDERSLHAARQNAEFAGVADQLHFQQRPFEQTSSKRQHGCVVTNPPYGQRLADDGQLQELYETIPSVLRRLETWSHFILTAYPGFERLLQKQADRRRKLYNGRIECTYYQFHGPPPGNKSQPAVEDTDVEEHAPVFGGLTAKSHEQAELFSRRLEKRARHLRRWPSRRGISCYRLYDRDIPEIPLVVDQYNDHLHISEYERPHDRDRAQHMDWLELMTRTAASTLDVDRKQVFLKQRLEQKGNRQHPQIAHDQYEVTVSEGGLKFVVNLSDYVDTGLFLDHRITRQMVQEQADGKRFLNLFAYTGSFSVYAAAGGAAETTSVDLSANYLQWAQRNMALNGFDDPAHRYVQADAREFLDELGDKPLFDLAVVDPPTFSNSKDRDEDWILQDHWHLLLEKLMARMSPGGRIYFSTNYRRFKFDEELLPDVTAHEISRQTIPEDYRNRRIHRCWLIQA